MAITQERMLALINSAADFQQGLRDLIAYIKRQAQEVHSGTANPVEAWAHLESRANIMLALAHPETSIATLALEHRHFQTHQRENERRRLRAQARRELHLTAPYTLNPFPFETNKLNRFDNNPLTLQRPHDIPLSRRAKIDLEVAAALKDIDQQPGHQPPPPVPPNEYDDDMLAELAITRGHAKP